MASNARGPRPPRAIASLIAAVVAIMSAATTIIGLGFNNPRLAIGAFIGMVVALMVVLLVNHAAGLIRAAPNETEPESQGKRRRQGRFWEWLARILAVFCLVYFMIIAAMLVPWIYVLLKAPAPSSGVPSIFTSPIPEYILNRLDGPDPLGMNVDAVFRWGKGVIPQLFDYLKKQEHENSHIHALNVLEKFGTAAFSGDIERRVEQIVGLIELSETSPGARSTAIQLLTGNSGFVYREREVICDALRLTDPKQLSTPNDLHRAKEAFQCAD